MGCIDRACVRRSTGCSCGSRIAGSEYGSLSFLDSTKFWFQGPWRPCDEGVEVRIVTRRTFVVDYMHFFPFVPSGQGLFPQPQCEYKQTTAPTSLPVTRPHQHNGVLHDVLLHRFPCFSRHGHCSLPLIHRSVPSSPNSALSLTRMTPQAQVKHSMSVAFSKKRVLSSGDLSESDFVSV